jgi:acyl-CoA reductase-like NAD-dependent aldehyde dehydrogenase
LCIHNIAVSAAIGAPAASKALDGVRSMIDPVGANGDSIQAQSDTKDFALSDKAQDQPSVVPADNRPFLVEPSPAHAKGEFINNTEPATGRELPEVRVTPPEEVREAIRRARAAQPAWAGLSCRERRHKLLQLNRVILQRADEFADVISRETGKPHIEALLHEVVPAADFAFYYARNARNFLRTESIRLRLLPNKRSYIHYQPRGVIGAISAWNFPFSFFMGDVICALAARNAVVVKASEFTPWVALKAKELCEAAGIPADLVQVVTGFGATGAALYDSPNASDRVDMLVFTGSVATGRKIGAACGERLIPCILELGGNAAAIVCADANLDRAAQSVVYGAFANAGQVCVSVNRVFVDERIAEPFTARVVERTSKLRQGAGENVDVGAMTTPAQLSHVDRHVRDAIEKGAKIEAGGTATDGNGRFFRPTVLTNVAMDALVMREETFGPVVAIAGFSSEDEAVRLANDSHFGLMGYVFSRDRRRAESLAQRVQAGTVIINDVIYTHGVPETPWGGVKQSGIGRVHGKQALKDMCEARHVNLERFHVNAPWSFPYREATARRFVALARWMYRLLP